MKNICIIIDFDNTIGYFSQFIFLVNIIQKYYCNDNGLTILDYFPNFFRPKIFDLFNIILTKKNYVKYFILYTRNNRPDIVNLVTQYIIKRNNYENNLFDITLYESSQHKSLNAVIQEIEKEKKYTINEMKHFSYYVIDNTYHSGMIRKNVTYIHCERYVYLYSIDEIINHFPFYKYPNISKMKLMRYLEKFFENRERKQKENKCLPYTSYQLSSQTLLNLVHSVLL